MNTKLRNQLRILGYGSTDGGELVPYREPAYRYEHERLGVIELNAPKDLAAKVVAALDEPAALVGVSAARTIVLFRVGRVNTPPQPLQFFIDGKQCSMSVSITAGPIDLSLYTWTERSPLNVRLADLPPLFPAEHFEACERVITQNGGRRGNLAEETALEKAAAERLEQTRKEIEQGFWTDEAVAAREDDALVARYEGQHLTSFDGLPALQVLNARKRVAERKRIAAEAALASTAA